MGRAAQAATVQDGAGHATVASSSHADVRAQSRGPAVMPVFQFLA